MRYSISVNKKYKYIKIYNILKRPNENTNKISKAVSAFLEKMLTPKEK
jgi:hypothetical protein